MEIADTTEELLWNVSALAMHATRTTREGVLQRNADLSLSPATQFEETTTSELLRNLAHLGQSVGVKAIQHSRILEGGRSRRGRQTTVPSGADLELAIEIAPGMWLDLLLQAKAFKASGKYSSWSPQQNRNLITWAKTHGRTPGMLLYNDLVEPFIDLDPPVFHGDYRCRTFDACESVDWVQVGWWGFHKYCFGPARTPAGISLCFDQVLMLAKPTPVMEISEFHFQLEHLLHDWEHFDRIDASGESLAGLTKAYPPAWAAQLLEAHVTKNPERETDEDEEEEDERQTGGERLESPLELAARMSAVIPFVGETS